MTDVLVVDRKGLAKKLKNKPKAFIVYELLQNAWDEDVTEVHVTAEMIPNRPVVRITVEDDCPEGFQDLASVYTMFRDSKKAPDPTKRGRFELGEKLVLALALDASIVSTKGSVIIEDGKRRSSRAKRKAGTRFEGTFRMTRDEFDEMIEQVKTLIAPRGILTSINGEALPHRDPEFSFETTLQTVRTDEEGNLKTTSRKTQVDVYPVRAGEAPYIYEMGIPVVETEDKWHYDVQQRVPVNWERNNVPPSYLKTLRVQVLNALHDRLEEEDATTAWVTQAIEDERCEAPALNQVFDHRFGKKRVIADPSDPEGTKLAMAKGYTVIPGGSLPRGAWDNVRTHGTALPAGKVTPSPKTYDPDGRPEKIKPVEEWSDDMHRIVTFAQRLFNELTGELLQVYIVTEIGVPWAANFGSNRLCLNYGRLGKRWFANTNASQPVLRLLIHEFGHHYAGDHLSSEFHDALCDLGARTALAALSKPELFE